MATTISAPALASSIARTATAAAVPKISPVLGLPHMGVRGGRVRCSAATARGAAGLRSSRRQVRWARRRAPHWRWWTRG
ncbi:Uncharacterized protein M6B38_215105 [Iris pallida]|uniref:Uncharacterized protein n=1 Tax=Iris pallida TaxID=29817 RepID=A0AAX6E1J4_IRIPA|nr:Uncharacterized protein M6B38_215105 [Iris pallida]